MSNAQKQSSRRTRNKILVSLFAFSLLAASAESRSHKPTKETSPADPSYVSALAAANRFLYAWQMGDLENGTVLLSDGVRHTQNADKLEKFFSGTDKAFEISAGHGNRGRYSFTVVLVTSRGGHVARRPSEIVMVNTGKDDWVVDKLP